MPNWEDLDPEEEARRARARAAYEKMYPLNKDDPYGVKRLESSRAQTPAGIQRACNRVMRELGLGELTDGQGSEQSKERLEPQEIDRNAYCRPTVRQLLGFARSSHPLDEVRDRRPNLVRLRLNRPGQKPLSTSGGCPSSRSKQGSWSREKGVHHALPPKLT